VANIDTAPFEDTINWLLDDDTTGSIFEKSLKKTFERQAREANRRFQVLQQSKTLENFFMRHIRHCAAHQVTTISA
jgi:hypothetical protein